MSITLRSQKGSKLTIEELDNNFISVRPYSVYVAILNQSGANAPVATVLENTIGEINWTYDSVGVYYGTLAEGEFDRTKTFITCNASDNSNPYFMFAAVDESDSTRIIVETFDGSGPSYTELGDEGFIEVRVY